MSKESIEKLKKEPWRIVVGVLAIGYIVYMWIEKDIVAIYSAMPPEEALPLAVTTVAVTLIKVALMAGGLLAVKWLIGKLKK